MIAAAALFLLGGCIDESVYVENYRPELIGHPPAQIALSDLEGRLSPHLPLNPEAATSVTVYVHHASCTNPQSRSLGSGSDGYVRVSVSDPQGMIGRAQSDFRGQEPSREEVQRIYETMMETLKWK